ncbi:hypothetical protein JTE90_002175 [Oedothorax gibbosus]|uniref:Uncharacterized protein n=1 Tax=Oedothorax gibbosus TaxID=931172 RepID=A0AAV6VI49_9ARAC|nr:hypothetical protein JTE90_002175 [Oedothorax gibbosus]
MDVSGSRSYLRRSSGTFMRENSSSERCIRILIDPTDVFWKESGMSVLVAFHSNDAWRSIPETVTRFFCYFIQ